MKRKIKAVGLALVAAFALNAVAAAGAQALEAEVEGVETATVTGVAIEHNETTNHTFKTFLGTLTCEETSFSGTVSNGATTVTVTPTYDKCNVSGKPATVTVGDCDYLFSGGSGGPTHFTGVTVDLECEESTGIYVHAYKDAAHTELLCEYVVHPFKGKTENTLENTGSGSGRDVDVTSTVVVTQTKLFGTFLNCGTTTQNATYTGGTTLRAYSDEAHNTQVGLAVK